MGCGQQTAWQMKRLAVLGAMDRRRIRDSIADANDPTNFPIVRRQSAVKLSLE